MKRLCFYAAVTFTTMMITACSNNGDNNSGNPTSPSPNPSASVRSIVVNGAPATTTTYRMSAKAEMSDGTSRDVTTQSQWSTSNTDIATIEGSGVLTVRRSGQVEVRASYQNMSGSTMLTVTAPQPPPPSTGEFILSGTVHNGTATGAGVAGATVRFVSGPNAGTSINTSEDGKFGFLKIKGGESVVEAQKDGYQVWRTTITIDRDREIDIVLTPTTTQ